MAFKAIKWPTPPSRGNYLNLGTTSIFSANKAITFLTKFRIDGVSDDIPEDHEEDGAYGFSIALKTENQSHLSMYNLAEINIYIAKKTTESVYKLYADFSGRTDQGVFATISRKIDPFNLRTGNYQYLAVSNSGIGTSSGIKAYVNGARADTGVGNQTTSRGLKTKYVADAAPLYLFGGYVSEGLEFDYHGFYGRVARIAIYPTEFSKAAIVAWNDEA